MNVRAWVGGWVLRRVRIVWKIKGIWIDFVDSNVTVDFRAKIFFTYLISRLFFLYLEILPKH